MSDPRRLVFGQVAELYDRSRPSYPGELVDDLIALSGVSAAGRALEVGAGTGKATRLFAARGVAVLAVEPDAEMAEVARRTMADQGERFAIVQSDFETWTPPDGERFPLLFSAQAWHWIDPAVRIAAARRALREGGLLAVFWNRPAWGDSPLRRALSEAYRAIAPDMPTDGPLHPDNETPWHEIPWDAEVGAGGGFTGAEVRRYPWARAYAAGEYADLLATLSEFRMLDPARREALLAAVREVIERHGGRFEMPMITRACLARAA